MKIYLNNFENVEIAETVVYLKNELPKASFEESLTFQEYGKKNNLDAVGGGEIDQIFSLAHHFATVDISSLAYGVAGNAIWDGVKKVIVTFKQSKAAVDRNLNRKTFAILISQPCHGTYYSVVFLLDASLSEDDLDLAILKIIETKDKLDRLVGVVFPEGIEFTFDTNNLRWQSHSKLILATEIN